VATCPKNETEFSRQRNKIFKNGYDAFCSRIWGLQSHKKKFFISLPLGLDRFARCTAAVLRFKKCFVALELSLNFKNKNDNFLYLVFHGESEKNVFRILETHEAWKFGVVLENWRIFASFQKRVLRISLNQKWLLKTEKFSFSQVTRRAPSN